MPDAEPIDDVKIFANSLREKKGVPWHNAKLELNQDEGAYVEYFRGKDFYRYFVQNPGKIPETVLPNKAGKSVEDLSKDLLQILLKRKLVRRTDRKFKKARPEQKRLVKYPRTLVLISNQQAAIDEGFYTWTYDRPNGPLHYLGMVLVPLVVIGACLFPLAPLWLRFSFLYFLLGLMGLIVGILLIRGLIFLLIWTVTGRELWIFPNLLSDTVSFMDAFSPFVSFSAPKQSQLLVRAIVTAATAVLIWILKTHSPDAELLAASAKRAQESLADLLDLYGRHKQLGNETSSS
uniref:Translocation protein SEC62 n=1 Tax=Polytomella parva TaxID=51329 RepID=A0A7S0YFT9_9CHLO|mmetsp:Transcript_24650/g.44355  ORF Transcript_24650/g.44355 Transcript_24650/m.44355 type:complete len:291 (+) Transcript_24650:106-978(+)